MGEQIQTRGYKCVDRNFTPPVEKYGQAAHAMFFARTDEKLWGKFPYKALVNMHLRFDGKLGFPGGMIDKGENVETALNREISEEMGEGNPILSDQDWTCSYYSPRDTLLLHFYCKEVDKAEFLLIEKRGQTAKEFGVEILGLLRVPLYTRPHREGGLPQFLKHNFVGNSRENLLKTLLEKGVLGETDVSKALKASYKK